MQSRTKRIMGGIFDAGQNYIAMFGVAKTLIHAVCCYLVWLLNGFDSICFCKYRDGEVGYDDNKWVSKTGFYHSSIIIRYILPFCCAVLWMWVPFGLGASLRAFLLGKRAGCFCAFMIHLSLTVLGASAICLGNQPVREPPPLPSRGVCRKIDALVSIKCHPSILRHLLDIAYPTVLPYIRLDGAYRSEPTMTIVHRGSPHSDGQLTPRG